MDDKIASFTSALAAWQPVLVKFAQNLILALVVIWVFIKLGKWVKGLMNKSLLNRKLDATVAKSLSNLTSWSITALGFFLCLNIIGIKTASLAAGVAALGFAIGLALQGSLSNFAAGIMILLTRPFKVGDFITTAGQSGTVESIDLFTLMIDTPDNRRIIIPNGTVFSSVIENVSFHKTRRVEVLVGTSYDASIQETRDALISAVQSLENGLAEPAPAVVLLEMADSSINWAIRVYCLKDDFLAVKEALTQAVKESLDKVGIEIPYPHSQLIVTKQSEVLTN